MPDDPKSGKKAPSFYSAAAGMALDGAGGKSNSPATQQGASGEKVKNVKVLLEVFDKMDKIEDNPELKDMIRQMSDTAKQYMDKLEGKTGDKGKPPDAPVSDGAAPGAMPGGPGGPAGGGGAVSVPA